MSDKLKDYWEKIKPFAIITNGWQSQIEYQAYHISKL